MSRNHLPTPPYEGSEPYLYFAFAKTDSDRAWKYMRPLLERGCRIWYCLGNAGSSDELVHRQNRASGASLTLVLLTDAIVGDQDTKTFVLVNQKQGGPILCLDTDGTDRRLSMSLREEIPVLSLRGLRGSNAFENAVVHSEGFSQELLGNPVRTRSNLTGRIAAAFLILAVLFTAGVLSARYWIPPEPAEQTELPSDSIVFADPVLLASVRDAVGGGLITEESISGIRVLRLNQLPSSWEELDLIPNLETLEISQSAIDRSSALPPDHYLIVLTGGDFS
ncbi:MAG: hypothetical protein J6P31_06320 [Oscillospiraceae bacterium]|nr:hypothetical protein [Oscillospiraceae bacterium]